MSTTERDWPALLAALCDDDPSLRVERVRRAGAPDEVLASLGDEAERLLVVEVGRGLEATEMLVPLADAAGSPAVQARMRRARARALSYAGRFDEALADCRTAAGLAAAAGHRVESARCRLAAMPALAELGRIGEAIAEGEAARREFLFAREPILAARADANLGTVHQRRGDAAAALRHFDLARAQFAGDAVTAAQLDSNRGEALLSLNDFVGAEQAFLAALRAMEAHGVGWGAAIVEGNLADLAARQGRLERALHFFELARGHVESDQSPGHLARLLAEQAEALAHLGLLEDARLAYGQALGDLDRCGLALEAARARAGLGTVLLRLDRHADAETALAAAARAFDELGHAAAGARVDLMRGELVAAHGRLAEARTLMAAALGALRARPLDAAVARYHLARLALAAGDLRWAEAELAEALPAAERFDVAPLVGDLLHVRGLLRRRQGRFAEAIEDLERAVGQIERVRGTLQAARFRAAWLGGRLAVYEDLVTALLSSCTGRGGDGDVAAAFHAAERAKGRSLLDMVSGAVDLAEPPAEDVADPAQAAIIRQIALLRGELNALYSTLDGDAAAPTAEWREAVRQRERELERAEGRLSSSRGVAGLYISAAGLAEVQGTLPGDAAVLEYFVAGGELLAFVVRPGGVSVHRELASVQELSEQVRRLGFQINRALRPGASGAVPGAGDGAGGTRADRLRESAIAALSDLHDMLIRPLASALEGARRLVVVPHGALHLVPFAALHDGASHLVESREIYTAPSASLLVHMARSEGGGVSQRRADALVVGVADRNAPGIDAEARAVAEALGARLLAGREATADRFVREAAGAGVIHLACHGRFSPEAPLASGLRLADRWLTVRDIYPLRLVADLVVLSGCETGRNLVTAGDELQGLLRGFIAAGARSLMASLWRVDDRSTVTFMSTFYNALGGPGGVGPGAALREAQCRMLSERRHPALWSPFFLVGRPWWDGGGTSRSSSR